jgi:hypothetical protein
VGIVRPHNPLNLISKSRTRDRWPARGAEDERRKCDQQTATMMDPAAGSRMVSFLFLSVLDQAHPHSTVSLLW